MDQRHATLCFLLALVLIGNASFAAGEYWETTSYSPICLGLLCKVTCWIGAKAINAKVMEATCKGSVVKWRLF
uniref:Uncharacterized protein n=1 Tax=Oryza glumipatula TaxID=40148 RepID=A0A0E0B978_9ORYZ